MNDALVVSACKLIAASQEQSGRAKPLQFHTGLGDNDISPLKSNPACLQPLIEDFPTVPIVLLLLHPRSRLPRHSLQKRLSR